MDHRRERQKVGGRSKVLRLLDPRLFAALPDRLFRSAMALDLGANLRMAGQLPALGSCLRDQSSHE